MHSNYYDILSRVHEEPTWWDASGTPRFGKFTPEMCPNIYADQVVLYRIACQSCGEQFLVEDHGNWYMPLDNPKKLHYGDPPVHGCVGDTMNCEDLAVLEVWVREPHSSEWTRRPDLEGPMDE